MCGYGSHDGSSSVQHPLVTLLHLVRCYIELSQDTCEDGMEARYGME